MRQLVTSWKTPAAGAGAEQRARLDEAERDLVEVEAGDDLPIDAQARAAKSPQVVRLKPDDHLRRMLVYLLFGLIALVLIGICLGLAIHWFDVEFGKTLLQVIVGPIVGALTVVIGYLFGERKRGS